VKNVMERRAAVTVVVPFKLLSVLDAAVVSDRTTYRSRSAFIVGAVEKLLTELGFEVPRD